jgi:hypothetical protein
MKTFLALPRRSKFGSLAFLFLLLLVTWSSAALAKTFAFPHVFEQKGRISDTPYTFDTTMFVTYQGGVACIGDDADVTVDFYWFKDDGTPLRTATGTTICAPCSFVLGPSRRSVQISLDDALTAAGETADFVFGHGLVVVPSDKVSVQGFVVNSHASPSPDSVLPLTPVILPNPGDPAGGLSCGRVFSANQLRQTFGVAQGTPYTFDTTMFMSYSAGLAGLPTGPGAQVDIYLFDDETGEPLADATGAPVCDPCSVNLGGSTVKSEFFLGGALPGGAVISAAVSAVCVVSGDAQNVALQAIVSHRLSSATEVTMYSPPMQEITGLSASSVPAALADQLGLRSYPNPFNPLTTFAYSLPAAEQVLVRVFDAHGALVREIYRGSLGEGEHTATWDGRDDSGRAMPSGVYFGRIETAETQAVHKVVLLK